MAMSQKRKRTPDEPSRSPQSQDPSIFKSSLIHDRSSTFQAHFCPDPSVPPRTIQASPEFKDASHRIVAWRKPSSQTSLRPGPNSKLANTGFDDDGEKHAGKRALSVLENLDVIGTMVVARWYGGVMLGPVRFVHIEDVAKEAVGMWQESLREEASAAKKKRLELDEGRARESLTKVLGDRDASIKVLRGMLTDMQKSNEENETGEADEAKQSAATIAASAVSQIPDYGSMTLERLKQLEKARDATIRFVLKQIDKEEERQN